MTTGMCSRCGTNGQMDYGSDGLMYCSSCSFYGMNKQCYRCRMYLPAAELQQYRGQWMCPYCVQDMRSEDRKAEEPEPSKGKPHLDVISYTEQCERCGRDLKSRVYIWNGKRLCKSCVNDEQEKWSLVGGGPMAAPYRISLGPEKRRRKMSLIESLISDFLHLLGIKRKEMEIIVIEPKMPIQRARPMAEKPMESGKTAEERRPKAEGLMSVDKAAPKAAAQKPGAASESAAPARAARAEPAPQAKTGPGGELSLVVPEKSQAPMPQAAAKPQKAGKKRRPAPQGAGASEKKKKQ